MTSRGIARAGAVIAALAAALAVAPPAQGAEGMTHAGAAKKKAKVVADSKFRPAADGYSFANYGDDEGYENLTVVDMRRLFGDKVCASVVDGHCTLLPTAQKWMETTNEGMGGGHCFGFAVTSQLFFEGRGHPSTPDPFGAPTVPGLQIAGNPALQSHIAYGFAYQYLPKVAQRVITGKKKAFIKSLIGLSKPGKTPAVLAILTEKGGHAITPFAVKRAGRGNYRIMVYDNNYPGQKRSVRYSAKSGKWSYELGPGATWRGSVKSGSIRLMFPRLGMGTNPCFFCKSRASSVEASAAGSVDATASKRKRRGKMEVRWSGDPETGRHGSLFIRDGKGRRSGCGAKGCVNRIPGADQWNQLTGVKPWKTSPPPIFRVLTGRRYMITLAGAQEQAKSEEGVEVIGRGFGYSADGIRLRKGERNRLLLSRSGQKMVFLNDEKQSQTPTVGLSTIGRGGSYAFEIEANGVRGGAMVAFAIKPKKEQLLIIPRGAAKSGRFHVRMTRYTDSGTEMLSDKVKARSGVGLLIDYGKWVDDEAPAPTSAPAE